MEFTAGNRDPFTILFDRLWEIVDANPVISELVRPGNKFRFETLLGLKETIQHGDLPEIVLFPDSTQQDDFGTSGTNNLSASYRFAIATGTFTTRMINQLQWEIYRVIQTFMANVGDLTYNEVPFVIQIKFNSGNQLQNTVEQSRGINGWCASYGFTVDMQFPIQTTIFTLPERT